MAKRKEKYIQLVYSTLHTKLRTEQHNPHKKPEVNSGAPEG